MEFTVDTGTGWVCSVQADGSLNQWVTFDPLSMQWIYLLSRGSFGMLRSREGWMQDRIAFTGLMTMVGLEREWRMTWEHPPSGRVEAFRFVNEERIEDGCWSYIDEWRFTRLN